MTKKDTTVEETDAETIETEETTGEVETETVETEESKEDSAAKKDTDTDIDYDTQIADEKKRGSPDSTKAFDSFKTRQQKKVETVEDEVEEDDKPLTRKDIAEIEARAERKYVGGQALNIANGLASNPKEAELVVARWNNRTFPEGTPLSDQIEEVYIGLPHVRKKLIGERNEALRALKGRDGVNRNAATSHRDSPEGKEPKISSAEATAFKGAGYSWNGASRQYEKKLPNGDLLVRDSKTKQTRLIKK